MEFRSIFKDTLNETIDDNLQEYIKKMESEMRLSKSRSRAETRKGNEGLGQYYGGMSEGFKRAKKILEGK